MTIIDLHSRRRNCFSWEAAHVRDRHRGLQSRPSCVTDLTDDDQSGFHGPALSPKQSKIAFFSSYRSCMGRQPLQHKYGSTGTPETWSRQSSRTAFTPTSSSVLLQRLQGVLLDAARLAEHERLTGAPGPVAASPHSPTSSSSSGPPSP
eukprot:EG_transcript_41199